MFYQTKLQGSPSRGSHVVKKNILGIARISIVCGTVMAPVGAMWQSMIGALFPSL
jgi:hypothetical protein